VFRRRTRDVGNEWVEIRRRGDVRRLAHGPEQVLADLARVRVGVAVSGRDDRAGRDMLVVVVVIDVVAAGSVRVVIAAVEIMLVSMTVRRAADDHQSVVVMVVR